MVKYMALQDFFGRTSEIIIIDFLIENMGEEYNQTEISECSGLSRTTIHYKLPELIFNKIVEISDETAKIKKFRLKDNEIVNYLIRAAFSQSISIADEIELEQEQLDRIHSEITPETEEPVDVYSSIEIMDIEFSASSRTTFKSKLESTQKKELIMVHN